MSQILKRSTKIAGLAVAKQPHKTLRHLYERTLRVLREYPDTSAYRLNTERIVRERMAFVAAEPVIEKLESKIDCGQIEEVILQAERELHLSERLLAHRVWEPLVAPPPPNQWKWPPA